jgi:hypothetical protein
MSSRTDLCSLGCHRLGRRATCHAQRRLWFAVRRLQYHAPPQFRNTDVNKTGCAGTLEGPSRNQGGLSCSFPLLFVRMHTHKHTIPLLASSLAESLRSAASIVYNRQTGYHGFHQTLKVGQASPGLPRGRPRRGESGLGGDWRTLWPLHHSVAPATRYLSVAYNAVCSMLQAVACLSVPVCLSVCLSLSLTRPLTPSLALVISCILASVRFSATTALTLAHSCAGR